MSDKKVDYFKLVLNCLPLLEEREKKDLFTLLLNDEAIIPPAKNERKSKRNERREI